MLDEETHPTPSENKPTTFVIALADDVKDVRADIEGALHEAARAAEAQGRAAPYEVEVVVEGEGLTFYPESPRLLLEDIRERFNPDVIVAVFDKHFGTAEPDLLSRAEEECERLAEALDRPGHPHTFIFFRDTDYTARTHEERVRKGFVLHFRDFFQARSLQSGSQLWWPFKRGTDSRSKHQELRRLAAKLLSPHVARRAAEAAWPDTTHYPVPELELPEGWTLIRPKELSEIREGLGPGGRLDTATAEKYFNGVVPTWRSAVSTSVPRRVRVEELEKEMRAAAAAQRLRVTLLIGPGGEGKSTMLHQLAVDLTVKRPGVHVIWHQSKHDPLGKEVVALLLKTPGSFVIASDDAEYIAKEVFEHVEFLHKQPRQNVQFLLACRSTDWEWADAPSDYTWLRVLDQDFRKVPVNRLEEEDARRVVAAWKEAGALGDFAAVREEERATRLVTYANEKEDSYRHDDAPSEDGGSSFLGAMLKARKSRTLEGYVSDILNRLGGRDALSGKTLRDVFTYVVALHADNQPILYRPVLMHLLSCKTPRELQEKVLDRLADEAATDVSGHVVLARHRRIAEVARDILCGAYKPPAERKAMRDEFEREVYPVLAAAAIRALKARSITQAAVSPWNKLPKFYAERQQTELALLVAEAFAEAERDDPMPVIRWAYIYRRDREVEKAVEIFRKRYPLISDRKLNKGYFTEWAAAEGQAHNHCIDAWLVGVALSDKLGNKHEGDDAPLILLSGLTSAFVALHRKASDELDGLFHDPADAETFLKGAVAAAQLGLNDRAQEGLREGYDTGTSLNHLRNGEELGREKHVPPVETGEAVNRIAAGIARAWGCRSKDEQRWQVESEEWQKAQEKLPPGNTLKFDWLRRVFGVGAEVEKRSAAVIKTLKPRPR